MKNNLDNNNYFCRNSESSCSNWSFIKETKDNTSFVLTVLVVSFIFILFVGCSENNLQTQEKECIKQDKQFFTKKVLNFRTGEYVIQGKCI